MKYNKVLFVGLGGAGQRHLRILRELMPRDTCFAAYRRTSATPFLRPDFTVDGTKSVETEYRLRIFDSLEASFADKPDLTVISTPTSCHREPMMMALAAGSSIVLEKPWAETLTGFAKFSAGILAKKLNFLISYQRRYHPYIARVQHALKAGVIGRPVAASFTVYSNVPAWHAYEDWRNLYAVRSDMGGGVLLTEIHEIDLAIWFFGLPDSVFGSGGNRSSESLSVEDTVQMLLLYANFSVQLTLCFMHKRPCRNFHIAGTNGEIAWDGQTNMLNINAFGASIESESDAAFSNDAMFVSQTQHFLSDWKLHDTKGALAAAMGPLAVVEAAKRSMQSGRAEKVDAGLWASLQTKHLLP